MRRIPVETLSSALLDDVVAELRSGAVIGFPTDTIYGLGADPTNPCAIRRVFEIKRRPESKPILLLVDSLERAELVSTPNDLFYNVASEFWPGPLTLIVPAKPFLPAAATAGSGTIGLRWPKSELAITLVSKLGKPITATSANQSGLASCDSAECVEAQLGADLPILLDGGCLPPSPPSTILDLSGSIPRILREGAVPREALAHYLTTP